MDTDGVTIVETEALSVKSTTNRGDKTYLRYLARWAGYGPIHTHMEPGQTLITPGLPGLHPDFTDFHPESLHGRPGRPTACRLLDREPGDGSDLRRGECSGWNSHCMVMCTPGPPGRVCRYTRGHGRYARPDTKAVVPIGTLA